MANVGGFVAHITHKILVPRTGVKEGIRVENL
jgi:hypothetical protein